MTIKNQCGEVLDIIGAMLAVEEVSGTWTVTETYYYLVPSPVTGLRRPFEMEIVRAQRAAPVPGDRYWYEADGLDSIVALTDESGDLAAPFLYDEYGQMLAGTTDLQLFAYTAQDYDPETGLYHFYARYYDPARGVWLTQDEWRGILQNPLTMHRYGYVTNNPTSWLDVQGTFPWLIAIAVGVGVITAGGILYAALTDDTPPSPPEERSVVDRISGYSDIKEQKQVIEDPNASTGDKIEAGAKIAAHTVKNGIIAGVVTYGLELCVLAGYELLTGAGTAACADGDCTNEIKAVTNATQAAENALCADGDCGNEIQIAMNKITDYLLKDPGKASGFEKMGFNAQSLKETLISIGQQVDTSTGGVLTEYGVKFTQSAVVTGPNGTEGRITTIWMIDKGSDVLRLITAWAEPFK